MKSENKNVLTAEEFLPKNINGKYSRNEMERAMVEFAKLHVEAALKAASEKVEFNPGEYISDGHWEQEIDRESILNSYSLDKIK